MKKFAIFSAVMIIGAGIALAQTLNVPFFRDGVFGGQDTQSWIGVKNTTTNDQVITIVYTALDASGAPASQSATHLLAAELSVVWRPVANLGMEGPTGRPVPNMTIVGPAGATDLNIFGSAQIQGSGGLAGRFFRLDLTGNTAFAHALVG